MNISTFTIYIALAILIAAIVVLAYVLYVYATEPSKKPSGQQSAAKDGGAAGSPPSGGRLRYSASSSAKWLGVA